MIVHRLDINQTSSLLRTGRALDHEQVELLAAIVESLLGPESVVADVGANFGVFTLALAHALQRCGQRGRHSRTDASANTPRFTRSR